MFFFINIQITEAHNFKIERLIQGLDKVKLDQNSSINEVLLEQICI